MFYGPDQAGIHHHRFGRLATIAAADLQAMLAARGRGGGVVVDLGCGSGILAHALTEAGYEVVGVDISPDMLALARTTAPAAQFVEAPLLDAVLPAGCVAVTATGEALNYATDARAGIEATTALAARIHDALVPGGVWLFDVSGPGRAGEAGRMAQFHRHDDWCLGMVATESEERRRLDRLITIFVLEDGACYRRVDEDHVLRLYERSELVAAIEAVGFEVQVHEDYPSAADLPQIPGWYVVTATKAEGRP